MIALSAISELRDQESTFQRSTASALSTFDRNCRILAAIRREQERIKNRRGGLNSLEIATYELERMHLWKNDPPYFTK